MRERQRNSLRSPFGWGVLGLLGVGVSALILGLGSASSIYDYQDTVDGVHLPPVDAIVVLAGGRGRIAAAGDLWNRYGPQAPILYFSGVGPQTNFKMVQSQLRAGVTAVLQPEQVVIENESTNTEENALWLLRYARERSWNRVLLVTSRYHMKRARLIFGRLLERDAASRNLLKAPGATPVKPLEIETFSVYQEPFEPDEWLWTVHGTRVTLSEYVKWVYYSRFWKP